jgi:hypothetical protein
LSQAKVRKVCGSLAELYVESVYIYSGIGGVKVMKLLREVARYKNLGTFGIVTEKAPQNKPPTT